MDLLKTPSVQSLLDSDLESVGSLQYLDIEELDEVEYALPASEAPTLEELLSTDADDDSEDITPHESFEDGSICSAIQVDFIQAISQQIKHAEERTSAGAATTLSMGADGRLTVGTAHGHILSFHNETLRWVCNANIDCGAVTCLSYNHDSTRLLVGYARGLICQYESSQGLNLRKITLGGETWGVLRVTWAGTSGLSLDTGGSVWLIKFSRPMGVRSARTSCLFSGARGEVVAMAARDARILALVTLSRVIVVAGGHAAGVRLGGPPDTLPALVWSDTSDNILICARSRTLQWIAVNVSGTAINLRTIKRVEINVTPLWLGFLGGSLAILDANESIRLWGDDYDKPVDLSHIEPVYASAFFKGLWTDGRVSRAMCRAGASALGGVEARRGAVLALGRRGVLSLRPRPPPARARAFFDTAKYTQALKILCSTRGDDARSLAREFIIEFSTRSSIFKSKEVADLTLKMCLKHDLLDDWWNNLWDTCSNETTLVEAVSDAIIRGELASNPPTPDYTQALIEKLADFEPNLIERVVSSLPLTSLDPHRASVFTRKRGLWRAVGAIATVIEGGVGGGAWRELAGRVSGACGARRGAACGCAGGALLLLAADALAARGPLHAPLPPHAQPSARHAALHALLDESEGEGTSPLAVLIGHDAHAAVRLLEQSAREPPFAGPLAKHNRLRVARAALAAAARLQDPEERLEVIEFITNQLNTGALPQDQDIMNSIEELCANTEGERADRALAAVVGRGEGAKRAARARPRLAWRLTANENDPQQALQLFFQIENHSKTDIDEILEYIGIKIAPTDANILRPWLPKLVPLRARAVAALVRDHLPDAVGHVIDAMDHDSVIEFANFFLESGNLQGDVAALHLRNLCKLKPEAALDFLKTNPGIVRPEDALRIVREFKIRDAEPLCLEATGDFEGALEVYLSLARECREAAPRAAWLERAAGTCARGAAGAPAEGGARLWARLLAVGAPPALLLRAAALLPPQLLLEKVCTDTQGALQVVRFAAQRSAVWQSAARVTRRELHERLARALRAAGRALAVRGACPACGAALAARGPLRTAHCARAYHAACPLPAACPRCARPLPPAAAAPASPRPLHPLPPSASFLDHALCLVAPPRPDLEGIV